MGPYFGPVLKFWDRTAYKSVQSGLVRSVYPRERFQTSELVRNFEDPDHVLERLAALVSPPPLRNPPPPGQQQSRFARH